MRRSSSFLLALSLPIAALLLASLARPARAGFLDKLGDAAGDAAARASGRTVERTIDNATKPGTARKEAPPQKAKAQPKAEPEESAEAEAEPPAGQAAQAGGGDAAGKPSATSLPVTPEVYSNRFDFVPGDKVLLYDDFTESDVGEHPARWGVKDGGGGKPVEVVEIGKQRFARCVRSKGEGGTSLLWLRYQVKDDLPKKFTVEFDADLAGPISLVFSKPNNWGGQEVILNQGGQGKARSENVEGKLPTLKGVQRVSVAVSGTQVKLYVAGERVLVDPDGVTRPVTKVGMFFYDPPPEGEQHQLFTNFRLAEGGKDAKTLLATGRIVTHGILFDTGSDVLRPESGPTLRSILALLQEDAALRFRVEGHTDDQGSAEVNGPLSERRAKSVKTWLVKQGIEEKRLEPKGLGSTKPMDAATTAEARANNRRVEFVKL